MLKIKAFFYHKLIIDASCAQHMFNTKGKRQKASKDSHG